MRVETSLVVQPVVVAPSSRFLISVFRSLVFVQASWDLERLPYVLFLAGVLLPAAALVLVVVTLPVGQLSCAQSRVFAPLFSAILFHPRHVCQGRKHENISHYLLAPSSALPQGAPLVYQHSSLSSSSNW